MSPLKTQDDCTFCGARQSDTLYATRSIFGHPYALDRCRRCRAIFLTPFPTSAELAEAYDDRYYGEQSTKFAPAIETLIDRFRKSRARTVRRRVAPPARVLDIGCGNGRFLGHLIALGYEGYGLELPGKAADRAAQVFGLHLKTGPLSKEDYEEASFDVVCMWHVFEHLTAPAETLDIAAHILRPSGYLLVSLPNIDSLQSQFFRGNWFHLDPPRHLFYLGRRELSTALARRGLRLVRVKYFSLEQNVFGIQQSILNTLCNERDVLFEAIKGNRMYTRRYSPWSLALQRLFWLTTFPFFTVAALLEAALRAGGTMELTFVKES
jgi:2-polyprenyl-3-methyl-5-hydroxy-6-metoxy-1,4-benzoquinol methylase